MFLVQSERVKIRKMIGKLEGFQKKIETSLKRQTTINQSIIDDLTALTQSSDPETQVIALEAILDDVRGNYYEQLRVQAPDDLTSYAEYMNPEEPPAPHHVYLCDRLTDMAEGVIPRMTISMPPGHAKSTYASRIFPSWWLGKNPKKRYIQAGHSQNFVENEFGKKTKAMVESERFSAVFPEVVLAADAKAAGYWSLAKHGGSYLTRGVGQGIAGFRAHMAGVDDPFATREDAESETIRNKVWDWFSADFTTRLLPDAPLFIVATRWHSDDLIGRVEDMNRKKKGLPWFIINLPAICTDIDDPMGREIDEPLWKDFYTIDTLMNLKATLPSRDWNSLYQGRPVDEEGGIIIGSWLQRYEKLPSRDNWKRVTVSVDSANKNTDRADFTAIGVWIEMINNCHYLVHVDRDKLELPKLIKRVENIIKEWGAEALLIEDKGSGTQYIQLMSQKSSAPIVPMSPNNNSKEFRLDGVSPMFEAGRVFIPKAGLWVPEYESELLSFPMGKYDDQVDMTSQYLAWVRKKITRGSRPLTGQEHTTGSTNKDKVKAEIEKNIAAVALRHAEDPIALALRMQREAEESGLIVPHHVGRSGTLHHLRQGR